MSAFAFIPRIILSPEAVLAAQLHVRLERFLARHRELPRRVELDFIHLGKTLQVVHDQAEAMNRETQETMALLGLSSNRPDRAGGGDSPDTLEQLRRLSHETLHDLDLRRRSVTTNLQLFTEINGRLGRLAATSETLRKLGLHLEVVSLNIGVESTRSQAIRELFIGIAPELTRMAGEIRRVAGEIDDECRHEQREQKDLQQTTARDLTDLKSMIDVAKEAVTTALEQIDRISAAALATMAVTEQQSAEIARQLARVVMGIQLHDSMSQRIAHIVEALEMVRSTLQALPKNSNQGNRRRKLATAHHIIELQGVQVEKILAEVQQARQETHAAFTTIAAGAALLQQALNQTPTEDRPPEQPAAPRDRLPLIEPCNRLPDAGTDDSETIPLTRLRETMALLEQLLLRSLEMISRLAAGSRCTAGLTAKLDGHMANVEKIRNGIHLMALNTIVMASQLDEEGLSMEVLAQETKKLSDLTYGFVGEVSGLHREISYSAQALQDAEYDDKPATHGASLKEIAAVFTRFNLQSAAAGQQIAELSRGLNQAASHLQFIDGLIADLETDRQILMEISLSAAPLVAGVELEPEAEESLHLEKLYTMDRERELHRNALSPSPTDIQQQPEEHDRQRAGKQTGSPPVPSPDPGGNIELF